MISKVQSERVSEVRVAQPHWPEAAGWQNKLGQVIGEKGIRTRRRLLDATRRLLTTTPLRDLSIADIARDAQTSTATFYVYFSDVSDAVLALIGEISQSPPYLIAMFQRPWSQEEAFDRAHEFVATYVEQWMQHETLFRVRNLASDEGDQRFASLRINAVSPLVGAMAERIAARQAEGGFPADLHPASMVGALLALVERIAVVRVDAAGDGITRGRLVRAAAFLLAVAFGHDCRASHAHGPALAFDGDLESASPAGAAPAPAPHAAAAATQVNLQGQTIGAKGARTRLRIIEATDSLVQSMPLREISISDIAKAAGTSASTIYLYFQDVQDVVLAALRQIRSTMPELIQLKASDCQTLTLDRAERLVVEYVSWWQSHRALFRIGNLASDEGDSRFIQARHEPVRPLLEQIAERVAERQAAGELPPDLHPASMAGVLLAMIDRIAVTPNIRTSGGVTLQSISRSAAFLLTLVVHGL